MALPSLYDLVVPEQRELKIDIEDALGGAVFGLVDKGTTDVEDEDEMEDEEK